MAISIVAQLGHDGTEQWVFAEPVYMPEDPLHEPGGCGRVFEGDVVSDRIKVGERGFGPDYFSHRLIR